MSNYGQQPPYGQNPNPYGQQPPPNPYGQQPPPYGQPSAPTRPGQPPYGAPPQQPYGAPQPGYGQQPPAYGQPPQPGQWTPQPPIAKKPELIGRTIPVVTMEYLPGREISGIVGEVVGVVARTRELRPDLRSGNPVDGYVTMLTESRQEAVGRLVEMAQGAGADAVVGLRFDCSEITQSLSEVAAYGTAVHLVALEGEDDVPEEDTPTSTAARTDEGAGGAGGSGGSSAAGQWPPSSWPSSS